MTDRDFEIASRALRQIRKVFVALIGGTILVIGIAMMVLPGPATVVIPVGLGILAAEFAWARRLLHQFRKYAEEAARRVRHGDVERESTNERA